MQSIARDLMRRQRTIVGRAEEAGECRGTRFRIGFDIDIRVKSFIVSKDGKNVVQIGAGAGAAREIMTAGWSSRDDGSEGDDNENRGGGKRREHLSQDTCNSLALTEAGTLHFCSYVTATYHTQRSQDKRRPRVQELKKVDEVHRQVGMTFCRRFGKDVCAITPATLSDVR
ncbi:hypothetical protein BDZ89DRAFT_1049753 [Hymenopellis radicata]|nr:hypothetical protein BDZ89DRAFT_1049753 [Hymenopellis radicata]